MDQSQKLLKHNKLTNNILGVSESGVYPPYWLFEWWSWWLTSGFRGTLLLDKPVSVCLCFSCVHLVFFFVEQCSYPSPCPRLTAEVKHASAQWMVMLNVLLFRERSWKWESHRFQQEDPAKTCKNREESGVSTFHATYTERAYFLKNTFKVFHSRANVLCDETKKDCLLRCLVKATQEAVSADNHIGS